MPLRNLTVPGVMAPRLKDRFSRQERELMLKDGISTTTVDAGGNVILERVITNYQKNVMGIDDESLLRLETKWSADYFRYFVRSIVATEFPRNKLADDGTKIKPGSKTVTPQMIGDVVYARCGPLEGELIEDMADFKKNTMWVRSEADPDRVNAILAPNLVNQFVTFAAAVQYRM
ncbi:hypothetical protein [Paludibacterium denitrificans]|uniref:hypothetical protein n=1 Tax=Paludibacterium denitrificans TaxID=2675226 RepID=UPI001E3CAD37|nr:hypothetical protein [Paludibacterium denitrificans]